MSNAIDDYNTINTVPVINFAKEYYWNPNEMWLLGASPTISGDTPASNVLHTMRLFQETHTKPRFCADKNGKVVPCDSPDRVRGGSTSEGTNDPSIYGDQIPNGKKQDNDYGDMIPGGKGEPKSTGTDIYDGILQTTGIAVDDWFKRIALVVIAIILIAIAVVSLR